MAYTSLHNDGEEIDMDKTIKELAALLGVSKADVLCLATSVANGINADGIKDTYLDANVMLQSDISTAYVRAAVVKFDAFATRYTTNEALRNDFQAGVLAMLRVQS